LRRTHFKHLPSAFNSVLSHFHDAGTNGLSAWNPEVQRGTVVRVLHQTNELGLLDLFERLVASDHPFGKERVEHGLIKITLQ
jgi:hypothetical protein